MPGRARRKRTPITSSIDSTGSSNKAQSGRSLIRRFHILLKRRALLGKQRESAENALELQKIEKDIEELGGLAAYQRMSSTGQGEDRGGGSEKVFISWLKELREHAREGRQSLRLLEVGALKHNNYASCSSWMNVQPIDLRSRHPLIREQDFLLLDQSEHKDEWDAISLSLVVNFVPDPHDRGRMLNYAHNMLVDGGLLFLALPLPCVSNSRYMTTEHLTQLMDFVGFEKIRERWKEGGKMAYWLFRKSVVGSTDGSKVGFSKKVVLRTGKRNNFCILMPSP